MGVFLWCFLEKKLNSQLFDDFWGLFKCKILTSCDHKINIVNLLNELILLQNLKSLDL